MKLDELNGQISTRQTEKLLKEHFDLSLDIQNISIKKAKKILEQTEIFLSRVRKSKSFFESERNPKYLSMVLVNQQLKNLIHENISKTPSRKKIVTEGQVENAQVVLAAKDLVDRIQDMVEELSKMTNEELPPLVAEIREVFGSDQADQWQNSANEILSSLLDAAKNSRDQLDTQTRVMAGEEEPQTDIDEPRSKMPAKMPAEVPAETGNRETRPEIDDIDEPLPSEDK